MDAFLQDLAQIFNHPPRPHRGTRLSADGGLKHQVEEWMASWNRETGILCHIESGFEKDKVDQSGLPGSKQALAYLPFQPNSWLPGLTDERQIVDLSRVLMFWHWNAQDSPAKMGISILTDDLLHSLSNLKLGPRVLGSPCN